MISFVLAVCLLILMKKISHQRRMILFGLAGSLLARRAFSTAAQDASFTNLLL
jgi:hypothetical protein